MLTNIFSDTRTLFSAKASKLIGTLKSFAITSTSSILNDSRPLPTLMKASWALTGLPGSLINPPMKWNLSDNRQERAVRIPVCVNCSLFFITRGAISVILPKSSANVTYCMETISFERKLTIAILSMSSSWKLSIWNLVFEPDSTSVCRLPENASTTFSLGKCANVATISSSVTLPPCAFT